MTAICCTSDLHGNLPEIPDCDLLLIAGDILPLDIQSNILKSVGWLNGSFRKWMEEIKRRNINIVGIAGNHDFIFESAQHLVPPDLSWFYLRDDFIRKEGLKIWGTPWQPYFGGWAFNAYEQELESKWDLIPTDTDIIVVHGPPYLYGDKVFNIGDSQSRGEHVGSPSLLRKIEEVKPKLVVCGHIYSSYGIYNAEETTVINASLVNEKYRPANHPIIWEL